jgi:hypothetical protein
MCNVIHIETAILPLYGINRLFFVTVKEYAKSMAKTCIFKYDSDQILSLNGSATA